MFQNCQHKYDEKLAKVDAQLMAADVLVGCRVDRRGDLTPQARNHLDRNRQYHLFLVRSILYFVLIGSSA
jgi:hypothetical protein